jgi:hypothetical protein
VHTAYIGTIYPYINPFPPPTFVNVVGIPAPELRSAMTPTTASSGTARIMLHDKDSRSANSPTSNHSITMDSSAPVTPASPKPIQVKAPQPGVPLFGCGMLCRVLARIYPLLSLVMSIARFLTDFWLFKCRTPPAAVKLRSCGPNEEHDQSLQELPACHIR